jgi:hypothetical protein
MYATLRGRTAIEDASRAFFTSFPDATLEVDAITIRDSGFGIGFGIWDLEKKRPGAFPPRARTNSRFLLPNS